MNRTILVGRLQTRQYETDNVTHYVTEVVCDSITFLENKKEVEEDSTSAKAYGDLKPSDFEQKGTVPNTQEEDLPF